MSTVYWTPMSTGAIGHPPIEAMQILFAEPQPLLKVLREHHGESEALQCPALLDFCRNAYAIHAPLDVTITMGEDGSVRTDTYSQRLFDTFWVLHQDGLLSVPPMYVFFAHKPVRIESLPLPLIASSATDNTAIVPGTYDISKWVRPVHFAFAFKDKSKPVVIKRGDPLFVVRFEPEDGSKVELERVEYCEDVLRTVGMCTNLKEFVPRAPLKTLYQIAASPIKTFLSRYRKCPFNFSRSKK
jgi:hypothetical protein